MLEEIEADYPSALSNAVYDLLRDEQVRSQNFLSLLACPVLEKSALVKPVSWMSSEGEKKTLEIKGFLIACKGISTRAV